MKHYKTLTTLAAAAGMLMASTASAVTLINTYDPSNITATASSVNNATDDAASKTVDSSGFNTTTLQHASSTKQSWLTAPMSGQSANGGISEQWIQWDLGASFTLDNIQIWNNNHSAQKWGLHQVDVYFSNAAAPGDPEIPGSGNGDNWTLWDSGNTTFTPSTFANGYEGFDLETAATATLPTTAVRWVRFEVDSARSDAGVIESGSQVSLRMGLSEIQFYAVPEPSSFALIAGMFGLTSVMLRRRSA